MSDDKSDERQPPHGVCTASYYVRRRLCVIGKRGLLALPIYLDRDYSVVDVSQPADDRFC